MFGVEMSERVFDTSLVNSEHTEGEVQRQTKEEHPPMPIKDINNTSF